MKKTENSKTITVYLDDETRERLKSIAEKVKVSRNRMALNLLIIGLDEAEDLRRFVKLTVSAMDLRDKIREKMSGVKSAAKATDIWEKPDKTKTMTLYMDSRIVERLDKLAGNAKINRNRLIANLLIMGLEESEALWKVGILQIAVFARDLRENIRRRLAGGTEKA